jgi:drug/metabolite transporter (DMT)-like permease
VVNNLSPLACVLLAFIFLKERLKPVEIIFLLLIAAGIIDIVLGASKTQNPNEKTFS